MWNKLSRVKYSLNQNNIKCLLIQLCSALFRCVEISFDSRRGKNSLNFKGSLRKKALKENEILKKKYIEEESLFNFYVTSTCTSSLPNSPTCVYLSSKRGFPLEPLKKQGTW